MRILSEGKFRNFDGFRFMGEKETVILQFDGTKIECTDDHQFLRDDDIWIEAKAIIEGEFYNGYKFQQLTRTNEIKKVYDAISVEDTNSFYAEGLTAHNCNFLYIDETAFLENWDEFFSSVYPTISSGTTTKILLTSTPKGLNHFHKICEGAKEGTNGYIYIEVPWDKVIGRDEKWKQETLAGLNFDYQKFEQEFNCVFEGSSGTLISGDKLKILDKNTEKPIYSSDVLFQYEKPLPDHLYTLIVDVSRGKGLDYSAFSIFDVTETPYKQVCIFRDNLILPADYAQTIFHLGTIYNEANILVEINDAGGQVADILFMDLGYENILFTESKGRAGVQISSGFGKNINRGIRTTTSVKAIGCNNLKIILEQNKLTIVDKYTIDELKKFSRKANSYQAESGSTDDLVMTCVLFSWLIDQSYFKELTDDNVMASVRNKSNEELYDELMPFGFVDDGSSYEVDDQNRPISIASNW